MDWNAVKARFNDLPTAYSRPGTTFQWIQNAIISSTLLGTQSIDGINNQLTFQNAEGGWLNVWGQLFNLPRNSGESSVAYKSRITFTLKLGRTTPAAIQSYVTNALNISATVSEDTAADAWKLTFTTNLTTAQYLSTAQDLAVVRPAGIAFLPLYVPQGGSYLGTINYIGAPSVTGAYLIISTTKITPAISANTNPAQPTLPTTYLTDTNLNPGLT